MWYGPTHNFHRNKVIHLHCKQNCQQEFSVKRHCSWLSLKPKYLCPSSIMPENDSHYNSRSTCKLRGQLLEMCMQWCTIVLMHPVTDQCNEPAKWCHFVDERKSSKIRNDRVLHQKFQSTIGSQLSIAISFWLCCAQNPWRSHLLLKQKKSSCCLHYSSSLLIKMTKIALKFHLEAMKEPCYPSIIK